jgi:hypothetical protein
VRLPQRPQINVPFGFHELDHARSLYLLQHASRARAIE